MPLVLVVQLEQQELRFPLEEGEQRVGSARECPIRLRHPTVSRHHALLRVGDAAVEIEDTDSSNGTHLEGQRLTGTRAVEPGQAVRFGTVSAVLQRVAADELQPAITFDSPASVTDTGPLPTTTVSLGSMQAFVLERLPRVLGYLEDGAGPGPTARAVGAALLDTLPCTRVEIAVEGRGEPAFLYRAETAHTEGPETAVAEGFAAPFVVRVGFLHSAHAAGYRPLAESAARIVALARPAAARRPPPELAHSDEPAAYPEPLTVEPAVRDLYRDARRVAASDVSVLITGESGTGKDVLARFLHRASARRAGTLVALNCAALPGDLLEAELFGIEAGVATGVASRPGKFELAAGGTLFLDEIGDMSARTQAKILRVLQEREVYRVGGNDPRSADVRVIAATNHDLDRARREGTFREDLYHRIADWRVELPPLRRRPGDIPNLAAHFLSEALQSRDGTAAGISVAALDALMRHAWPGNIRQLQREMSRAALFLEDGQLLGTDHLSPEVRGERLRGSSLRERLEEVERQEIHLALARCSGNVAAAAERLGLGRSTLYRRIQELGIEPERPSSAD